MAEWLRSFDKLVRWLTSSVGSIARSAAMFWSQVNARDFILLDSRYSWMLRIKEQKYLSNYLVLSVSRFIFNIRIDIHYYIKINNRIHYMHCLVEYGCNCYSIWSIWYEIYRNLLLSLSCVSFELPKIAKNQRGNQFMTENTVVDRTTRFIKYRGDQLCLQYWSR